MFQANGIAEAKTLSAVPLESFEQLFDERAAMYNTALPYGRPQLNPIVYYEYIEKRGVWEAKARKYILVNKRSAQTDLLEGMVSNEFRRTASINQEYIGVFSINAMQAASDTFWKTHTIRPPETPADYTKAWPTMRNAYPSFVFIWACGLALWEYRRGMKVRYEVPRIIIASLLPIISSIVYPVRLDKTRQVRSALEFACGVLMFIFSFGTAAGSLAKAQLGPFGGKSSTEETKKKKRHGIATLLIGGNSQLPGSIGGSIFDGKPNLNVGLKLALDNGLYASVTQYHGLDHLDPDHNASDWIFTSAGYVRKFGRTTVTVEGTHMNAVPFSILRGDYLSARAIASIALGKTGRFGSIYGSIREMWKFRKGMTPDTGIYGYFGHTRDAKVPHVPVPIATSSELRFDPGNLGRGPAVGFAGRLGFLLPKIKGWIVCPFIGTQGPIWKERPVKTDNRSWELFGGFTLAFSARI